VLQFIAQRIKLNEMDRDQVIKTLLERDQFTKWLGLELLEHRAGYIKLRGKIRAEMMNGIGSLHGGVTFAMADSAFAFTCNMENMISVALEVNISFTKAGYEGDVFTIVSKEINTTRKIGIYEVTITNQHDELVALFRGTCYRVGKTLLPEN
jgi:acyl-CoA thioesterase